MKNRANQILVLCFVVSLTVYIGILSGFFGNGAAWPYLLFGFHGLPVFCLQLFLCRITKHRMLRLLPVLLPLLFSGYVLALFVRNTGWDRLVSAIFAVGTIAPAVGCALGWGVWALCRRKQNKGA